MKLDGDGDSGKRCPSCNYNLTGLEKPRCPECGCRFDLRKVLANAWMCRRPRWVGIAVVLVFAGAIAIGLFWFYMDKIPYRISSNYICIECAQCCEKEYLGTDSYSIACLKAQPAQSSLSSFFSELPCADHHWILLKKDVKYFGQSRFVPSYRTDRLALLYIGASNPTVLTPPSPGPSPAMIRKDILQESNILAASYRWAVLRHICRRPHSWPRFENSWKTASDRQVTAKHDDSTKD